MYAFARFMVSVFMHLKYKMHVLNKNNIPLDLKKGGYIIACNHQKYYDPVAIAAVFKGKFSFMAKAELFAKNKAFAWIIKKCGAFPVVRGAGDNVAIDQALGDIKNKRIFVIFPEGTRSKDGTIGRGRSGVALIAAKAGVPVIPVCVMYGLGGKKRRLDFAIGNIISPEEIEIADGMDRQDLKRVSNVIMDEIKALQQEIYDNIKSGS